MYHYMKSFQYFSQYETFAYSTLPNDELAFFSSEYGIVSQGHKVLRSWCHSIICFLCDYAAHFIC